MNVSRFYDKYIMLHVNYISKLEKKIEVQKKLHPKYIYLQDMI